MKRMRAVSIALRAGVLVPDDPNVELALRDDLLLELARALARTRARRGERTRSRHVRPGLVPRTSEWLAQDARTPKSVPQIARHFGVSTRHLYRAFHEEVGIPPAKYLRRHRMTRARLDLLRADPAEATVTGVATSWGFWELGRFAVEYRRLFGEMPSQTLRTYVRSVYSSAR